MKKTVGVLVVIILVIALSSAGYFFVVPLFSEEQPEETFDGVYVMSVEDIVKSTMFSPSRYSGVVETEELVKIDADSDKKIKKTYVKEGDTIKKGDKLFEYDIDEMRIQLDQDRLNIAQKENVIKDYNTQIEALEKEKKTLSTNKQLTITNQIEGLKLEIKKAEFEKESLEREIKKLEVSVKNNVVKSAVNGTVKSVDDPTEDCYIAVASDGDFRIKALVSELNVGEFTEGDQILIRSRLDSNTWKGQVTSIDTAKPTTDNNSMFGGDNTAKYPVYIDIEDTTGLMIGQHVTVELSFDEEVKDGVWLNPSYILNFDKPNPYVWAESSNKTIEKRTIEIGEFDENSGSYQIKSGITEEDYIAFPEDRITQGMETLCSVGMNNNSEDEDMITLVAQ